MGKCTGGGNLVIDIHAGDAEGSADPHRQVAGLDRQPDFQAAAGHLEEGAVERPHDVFDQSCDGVAVARGNPQQTALFRGAEGVAQQLGLEVVAGSARPGSHSPDAPAGKESHQRGVEVVIDHRQQKGCLGQGRFSILEQELVELKLIHKQVIIETASFPVKETGDAADKQGMIKNRWMVAGMIGLLLGAADSSSGLDLSPYREFLGNRGGATATPRKTAQRQWLPVNPIPKSVPADAATDPGGPRVLSDDADASWKGNQLVTLGPKSNSAAPRESLSLPASTRVPEGLRPLLTERKTPRQGISLTGGSGALLVPSPGVLEPGKTAVSVHAVPFDLYDISERRLEDASYFDTAFKLVYGLSDGVELGVDRTFTNQDRFDIPEPTYLNLKYQVPGNVTIGGSFSAGDGGYSSAWVSAGVPVIWVGVGGNFGPDSYKFYYNGYQRLARAKFGGYNYKYDRGEGYADPIWFMVGGAIPMTDYTHFLYDFNGDRFSLGFRFNYQKVAFFDASYVSDGDYERLPGAVAHKRLNNFVFGGSIVF